MVKNILSFDVEEIFQAEFVRGAASDTIFRTPSNIFKILDLLDEHETKATFFIVGKIAEKFPWLLKEIYGRGHEIGFHSYDHVPLSRKTAVQMDREIREFNSLLYSETTQRCKGFRAPSFSLNGKTAWAIEALEKAGLSYDSSVFPSWTPLYGLTKAPYYPYKPSQNNILKTDITSDRCFWEFPLATFSLMHKRLPAAGGFYLRIMPTLVRRALKQLNNEGFPGVLYLHNWELDSETPRYELPWNRAFVTYHNIKKTESFIRSLLKEIEFTSFSDFQREDDFNNGN